MSVWLRNGAFALFVVVMFFVLRAALQRQAVEEGVARREERNSRRAREERDSRGVAVSSVVSTESAAAPVGSGPKPAGKRDVWIVFWIVPAFYTAFGIIFFALARVMPPPRPDVTTDQMVHFFDAHARRSRSASESWS